MIQMQKNHEGSIIMTNTLFMLFVTIPVFLLFIGGVVYLFVLLCRALKKYIHSSESRKEQAAVKKSLGEVLKAHRIKNKMTQEFVAQTICFKMGAGYNRSQYRKFVCTCKAIRCFCGRTTERD